ncbi:hypothetical protein LCGC14_1323640 [marine sediment metagenome]|uniref:Uncharacterized protein n=1 Tax=marine sediment metagenome TaxID=412755 RepID=A0A0F9MZJ4_9ZZZZ
MTNRVGNGFRCFQCGGIFDLMWGTTCNGCRKTNYDNAELRKEGKLLREQLAKNLACKEAGKK